RPVHRARKVRSQKSWQPNSSKIATSSASKSLVWTAWAGPGRDLKKTKSHIRANGCARVPTPSRVARARFNSILSPNACWDCLMPEPGLPLLWSEEQTLLSNAARKFMSDNAPVTRLRTFRDHEKGVGFDLQLYQKMATLGWLGLIIAEEFGGHGLGYSELC